MKGRMLGQISCWLKGQQTEQIIHIWAGIWPVLTPCKDTMFAQFISNTGWYLVIVGIFGFFFGFAQDLFKSFEMLESQNITTKYRRGIWTIVCPFIIHNIYGVSKLRLAVIFFITIYCYIWGKFTYKSLLFKIIDEIAQENRYYLLVNPWNIE